MKRLFFIISALFFSFTIYSQSYNWKATIEPVNKSGFYNILLTPEVTTHLKENFSDLRLFSKTGAEVGYILRTEQPSYQQDFNDYVIVKNKSEKNCCTQLVLRNPVKNKINNIHLEIRNSNVKKKARLTGSDDAENWYAVSQDFDMVSVHDAKRVSKMVILHFPFSNYEYYKLEIQDSASAPLQILKAGYLDTHLEEAKYLELPKLKIQQKDSTDKKSYISFSFPSAQFTDKLLFKFEGPIPYYRKAVLCTLNTSGKKHFLHPLIELVLKSGDRHTLLTDGIFAKDFYLIIDNLDNSPLQIKEATAFQLMNYLTTNLNKDESYILKFGNTEANAPQYDLEYFRDSLSNVNEIILPSDITAIPKEGQEEKLKTSSSWWIWLSIAGIGGLLAFMSVKMIREMKGGS